MASYVLIRGWIECDFEDVVKIKESVESCWMKFSGFQVEEAVAVLYGKGWSFPVEPINWVSFVFFGASINKNNLLFVKGAVLELTKLGLDIKGLFYVDDEDDCVARLWRVSESEFVEEERD